MKSRFLCIIGVVIFLLPFSSLKAQSTGYSFHVGPNLGFQKWGYGSSRAALLAYHFSLSVDSESSEGNNIIYGDFGYHVKGGAIRYQYFQDLFGNRIKGDKFNMACHNLALEAGVRKMVGGEKLKTYFGIGARAEYTVKTDFEINKEYEDYLRKFNYGLSFIGGIEYSLGKTVKNGWQIKIAPDISKQIFVPAGILWYDPYTRTSYRGTEISTRNLTIELSTYIRLLQLIEYEE